MSQVLAEKKLAFAETVANLITEDDEPVDNVFSEKQQRLLAEPLYSSWTPPIEEGIEENPRNFLAAVNVGVFFSVNEYPLVPDMFLSLDIEINPERLAEEQRSYFVWEFGKVPEVVVEIVSNRKGNELTSKLRTYSRWGVTYYVVFDPMQELGETILQIYELGFGKRFRLRDDFVLPEVGLSLKIWRGRFENVEDDWIRWCDAEGNLILSGVERAEIETERAEFEHQRAERMAEKLRELGIDVENL